MFDDVTLKCKCPGCSNVLSFTKELVNTTILCPQCNSSVVVTSDGFAETIKESEDILRDFRKNVRDVFK